MTPTPTILVISEADASAALCGYLARFQLNAVAAHDAASACEQLFAHRVDLVVLDLMLHDVDGLGLTRALHTVHHVPVILLSGHGSAAERIVGLEMGADDCMDRPLIERELVARIQTVLRRTRIAPLVEGWELRRSAREMRTPDGESVALSNAEYRLLHTLLQQPGDVVHRDELAASAGERAPGRSVDLLVSRLRQKLARPDRAAPIIHTVRGQGYRLEPHAVRVRG